MILLLFQSFFKMYQTFLIVYKPEKMDYIKISGLGKTQEEIQTERKLSLNSQITKRTGMIVLLL